MSFLVFAVVTSALGIGFVLWRSRRAGSVEEHMDEFTRGLRAIAPAHRTGGGAMSADPHAPPRAFLEE